MNLHQRVLGPTLTWLKITTVWPAMQLTKKYAGQPDAEATLAKSIKAGGSGKWGTIPMPAQAQLSDADAKALAAWVLAGAK